MKKLIIAIMLFCATGAFAAGEHQVATSQAYVAEELDTRQNKFDKLGSNTAMTYSGSIDGVVGSRAITGTLGAETNTSDTSLPTVGGVNKKLAGQQDTLNFPADTILMNTGMAGAPTTKAIYDDSGSYNAQTDALIDAATFNAAMQNAINSELVCAVRKDPNDPTSPCYLFDIVTPTTNLIIPDTYTRLEYLESTETQYIDTGILSTNNIGVAVKYAFTKLKAFTHIFGTMGPHYYLGIESSGQNMVASYGPTAGNVVMQVPISDVVIEKPYELNVNFYNSGMAEFVGIGSVKLAPKNFSGSLTMRMSEANGGGGRVNARIYYMRMTDGTTLVRNFIPAKRNSDGKLGMYDTVTNTFFTNAVTSGADFIAGPELSSNIYLPMK